MNKLGDIHFVSMGALLPELYLGVSALFLLLYGAYRVKEPGYRMAIFGIVALVVAIALEIDGGENALVMNGMFTASAFTVFAKCLVLGASAMVLLISGRQRFEFTLLVLLSTLGMMFMVSANDFLTLYLALEMSSLGLYVLASFDRDDMKSSEAGLKYFVLGALASGMMLFGISLVYGFAGSIGFSPLGELLAGTAAVSKGLIVGVVLIIIGFCFKLSAVPFHMWAPDAYEGAPTPAVALFATAPKIAALTLFSRVLFGPFGALLAQWQQVIVIVSLASMVVGALAAIRQTDIKRLLAYSSIGHVGFMLMGLAAGNVAGVQAALIYLAIYAAMSLGAFGCVMMMKRGGHEVDDIYELRGLSQTSPLFAFALAVFMFALAGIPPLSGFFGKWYVVLAAISGGLTWLAVLGVITSVVGCYYYIRVVKVMYFDEPAAPFDAPSALALRLGVAIAGAATLLFFLVPTPLVSQAGMAASALFP